MTQGLEDPQSPLGKGLSWDHISGEQGQDYTVRLQVLSPSAVSAEGTSLPGL